MQQEKGRIMQQERVVFCNRIGYLVRWDSVVAAAAVIVVVVVVLHASQSCKTYAPTSYQVKPENQKKTRRWRNCCAHKFRQSKTQNRCQSNTTITMDADRELEKKDVFREQVNTMNKREAGRLEQNAKHQMIRIVCPNCSSNFPFSLSTYPVSASLNTVPPFIDPTDAYNLEMKTFVEGPSWKQICPYCNKDVLFVGRVPELLVRAESQNYWTSKQGQEDKDLYEKIKNEGD